MREKASFLPEGIIIGMIDDLLPEEIILVVFFGDVFQRSEAQVKIISVFGCVFVNTHQLFFKPVFFCLSFLLVSKNCKGSCVAFKIGAHVVEVIKKEI